MTQHIKCVVICLLLISLSCSGNNILERSQQDQANVSQSSEERENFIFFRSFQFCDNPYAAFTQEEANSVYLTKEIHFDFKSGGESLDWNSFFYEGAKKCVEEELGEEQISAFLFSSKEDFPFEEVVLFNNQYVLVAQDGFFFVFKEKKEGSLEKEKTIKEGEQTNRPENGFKSIMQTLWENQIQALPLEYSYELVSELRRFQTIPQQGIDGLEHLSDFQFSKLPAKGDVKLLLVSGYMESGQSEMYLLTLNNSFEKVDALLLYTSEEIEGGSISTRFKISENHLITVTKEEKGRVTKLLEEKLYTINSSGKFVKTKK